MKKAKIISILFLIIITVTSLHMLASATSNDIFFATDMHGKTSNFTNVLASVKKDTDIGIVALGGDYELSVTAIKNSVNSVFPEAEVLLTTGNHDNAGSGLLRTGEAYVNDHFSIFMMAYDDFKNTNALSSLSDYLKNYNTNKTTSGKPLFIVSHLPLHADRRDNTNAYRYANLLNEYGKSIDIIFLWGHNHTVDKTLYFKTIGDELAPEGGSKIKLNFTYVTAGYIKEGYGTAVRVNDDTITFQRYNTSGKFDSPKTIKRQIPAFNCDVKGHNIIEKRFKPDIKAYTYTCANCRKVFYERLRGDCDGNGMISSSDARLALRFCVGLEALNQTDAAAANVDQDDSVTSADARYILRKAVRLSTESVEWSPISVNESGDIPA